MDDLHVEPTAAPMGATTRPGQQLPDFESIFEFDIGTNDFNSEELGGDRNACPNGLELSFSASSMRPTADALGLSCQHLETDCQNLVRETRRNSTKAHNMEESNTKKSRGACNRGYHRPHYAVEKKYRATLNANFAALATVVSSDETREICRTQDPTWSASPSCSTARQDKTKTLSSAIDTIDILSRCCRRKMAELQGLKQDQAEIMRRMKSIAAGGEQGGALVQGSDSDT